MEVIKKFHITILTAVLLLITFGTVTYAWISLSTVNNIEGLSLTATTGDELLISLDGTNFSSNLTVEDLEALFEDITLNEVTSIDGINFEAGGLRRRDDINPDKDYLQFDVWFQTTEDIHQVYLINNVSDSTAFDVSNSGTYIISRGVNWRSDQTFVYGADGTVINKGDELIYYASDAVRLSFVEQVDDHNELDIRNDENLMRWIFDPSGDEMRGYGKDYGAFAYFVEKTHYYLYQTELIQEVKYHLTNPDPRNPYQALDNDSIVTNLQDTGLVNEDGKSIYQGKLKITLWIEGWDADAFDAIDGDRLKIQLQFKLLRKAEEVKD